MSVCLTLCPLAYHKNGTSAFHQIFCTCYTWSWLGPPLMAMRYVTYFRFCGWLHVFMQWREKARIKNDTYVSSSSPGGGTGDEVCRLKLQLFTYLFLEVDWTSFLASDAAPKAANLWLGQYSASAECGCTTFGLAFGFDLFMLWVTFGSCQKYNCGCEFDSIMQQQSSGDSVSSAAVVCRSACEIWGIVFFVGQK